MKRTVLHPVIDPSPTGWEPYYPQVLDGYKGWQLGTAPWVAVNPGHSTKLKWTLYHAPTGRWVVSFPLREHVVRCAELLDEIGDWSEGIPSGAYPEKVCAVFRQMRVDVALEEAEKALEKAEKDALPVE
jgi:hypothetical protein